MEGKGGGKEGMGERRGEGKGEEGHGTCER